LICVKGEGYDGVQLGMSHVPRISENTNQIGNFGIAFVNQFGGLVASQSMGFLG
jgi:hypothetical protein